MLYTTLIHCTLAHLFEVMTYKSGYSPPQRCLQPTLKKKVIHKKKLIFSTDHS